MATIRFGSNTFSAGNEFTIVGLDDMGNLIMGGFGLTPKTPLVWISFKGGGAFLNAHLADADGETVLQIRDNVITVDKNNIYKVEQHPNNQIPPDRSIPVNLKRAPSPYGSNRGRDRTRCSKQYPLPWFNCLSYI